MATFAEEYKALDTVPGQKAKQYQFLSDNRSNLQLTPDEEYRFNWGPEAVSEDWISGKAKQIQSEIENANSTAILRRGLGKGEEAKSADQETKEETKSAGEIDPLTGKPRAESNHGNDGNSTGRGDGTRDTSTNDPANDSGWSTTFGWDGLSKTGALAGKALGPIGMLGGAVIGGITMNSQPTAERQAVMDQRAAGLTAEANAMAEANRVSSLDSMQDALNADSISGGGGFGLGDSDRDHGNSGSAPGGGA